MVDLQAPGAPGQSAPRVEVPANATVVAEHLDVVYRVYEDRRPQLREIFSKGGKRPQFREIHAVRDVSFTAHEGEAIGLIGRNGSGKSTLLQALAGLLPPTSGAVYARSQPSLLGVNAAMKPNLSGRRNIVLGGLALGMSLEEIERRMDSTIRFAQLDEFIDLPMRTYSSGMRARLLFAIATSVKPDILLIDEALAVGDSQFKRRSQKRIKTMLRRAGTVFLVSHNSNTIAETCQRALWLERGQLVEDGPAAEVVERYESYLEKESDG